MTRYDKSRATYKICNVKLFDTTDDNLRTTLYWNGGTSDTWDTTTANWLKSSGAETAWIPGARACFTNHAAATVAIAAGGVEVSCIQAYGHPLTFTGGTLTMVGSSELVMRTGRARFECPIAGEGGFRVVNRLYKNLLDDTVQLSTTPVKIFENASLAEISGLYASPTGQSVVASNATGANSYHVSNDGKTLTAQMQWFEKGGKKDDGTTAKDYTKCVIVELNQNGADILAKYNSIYYHTVLDADVRGRDFNSSENRGVSTYRLVALRLGARVELAGTNTFTGPLHAEGATTIALDGGTLSGGDFKGVVSLPNSTLEISHTRQKFSGKIVRQATGSALDFPCSLVVKGTIDPSKNGTRTYDGTISGIANGATQMLFPDVGEDEISGWIGAEAYFTSGLDDSMGSSGGGKAETFFFWNDGMTAKAQFKIVDDREYPINQRNYIKAAIYEFSHNGSGIVAKRLSSCYNGHFNYNEPNQADFMGLDLYDFDVKNSKYRCKDLTVVVSNISDTVVTLAAEGNTFGKGYITVDGAVLGIKSAYFNAPEYYNSVNVKNKGKLFYTGNANFLSKAKATVDGESRLAFCRPGSLSTYSTLVAKNGSEIVIEGGSITNTTVRLDAAKYNWCSHLTLNGGTTLSGGPFAVGGTSPALTVSAADGTGAARIAQSFYIKGKTVFTFDVADVSGDNGADLLIDGQVRDNGDEDTVRPSRPLKKTGAGTLRLGASNKRTPALYKDAHNITQFGNPEPWTGKFTVSEGTLLCGVDEALDGMSSIVLAGGKLDVDGTKTVTGTLTVSQNGEIALGDGGEISFADSSTNAWTSGKTLAVTGTGRVRFGTTAQALTETQLAAIRLNGRRVRLNSSGYVRGDGFRVIFK